MKECNKCKNILSLDEFHNNKRMKDGKQRSCKACVKIKDAKHWVESGKSRPRRVGHRKIMSFKQQKIDRLTNRRVDLQILLNDFLRYDKTPEGVEKYWKCVDDIEYIKSQAMELRSCDIEHIRKVYNWSKSKSKHESKFLANIDQCENGRYLYIMKWRDLYKVGISNNPLKRRNFIKYSLPGSDKVDLLYVCKPYKGRSIDNETLIHKSLKEYRADVTWKDGKKSREFFKCDLSLIKLAVSEQCYIEDAKELMA
jgi:hypothetical protein